MADSTNAGNLVDPIELWRQWNETTATMWTSALDSTRQAYDSSVSYPWLKNTGNAQEPDKPYPALFNALKEIWQTWFDATMEIWQQTVSQGGSQAELAKQWLKMMEEAQAKLQAGEVLPIDPFTLFRDWYNASNEEWARNIESILGSEKFLQSSGPLLESYAGVMRAFRRANEAYFKKLQLPTSSDISRVAELVIALEEKVDRIEDGFEDLEGQYSTLASSEMIAGLQERLNQTATNETLQKLATQVQQLASSERVAQLEKRLSGVEEKLDLVLSRLAHSSKEGMPSASAAPVKRTRKVQKKEVE
jgi:hypothetical protein